MRSIVIGTLVAAGLTFVSTASMAAPASAVISQAAAEMSPVSQVACKCLKFSKGTPGIARCLKWSAPGCHH